MFNCHVYFRSRTSTVDPCALLAYLLENSRAETEGQIVLSIAHIVIGVVWLLVQLFAVHSQWLDLELTVSRWSEVRFP